MPMWVNVWGKMALLAPLVVACIDDFDDPKGYGPSDGTRDTFGDRGVSCTELCREGAACGDGIDDDDCREQCDELTQVSRRAGCTEDFEELLDCLAGLSNA